MSIRRGAQIGFLAALVMASACVPAPKAPEAPPFDPKVMFRDLAKGSSRPMVVDWTRVLNDEQLQRRSCDGGSQSELGCFNAAVVYADDKLGFQNKTKMIELAKRACKTPGAKKDLCKSLK